MEVTSADRLENFFFCFGLKKNFTYDIDQQLHILKKLWYPEVSSKDVNQRGNGDWRQIIVRKGEENVQAVLLKKKDKTTVAARNNWVETMPCEWSVPC